MPLPFPAHLPHLRTKVEEVELGDSDPVMAQFMSFIGKWGPINIKLGPVRHRLQLTGEENDLDGQLYCPSASSAGGRRRCVRRLRYHNGQRQ